MKIKKWYFDLVSDTGQVFIGYGVYLELFRLTIPWRACFLWDNDSPVCIQGIGRFQAIQTATENKLIIQKPYLEGCWLSSIGVPAQPLIQQENISVCWQGISLASKSKITLNNQEISGQGYVECLSLSLKRAHLPFKKLHWGRFISHSGKELLVWIQFDGDYSNTFIFDGHQSYCEAFISQQQIIYPGGLLHLEHKKSLLQTQIASHVPFLLEKLFGGSAVTGKEQKWLSAGVLITKTGQVHQGWVIHEEVTW